MRKNAVFAREQRIALYKKRLIIIIIVIIIIYQ